MMSFLSSILRFILYLFKSREKLLLKLAVLDKENQILKRQNNDRHFRRVFKEQTGLTPTEFKKKVIQ